MVQYVLVKLWNNKSRLRDPSLLKSYLFSIAYHAITDLFRERLKDRQFREVLEEKGGFYRGTYLYSLSEWRLIQAVMVRKSRSWIETSKSTG